MTFRSFMDTQWDGIADMSGNGVPTPFEDIYYTPSGGVQITVKAIIDRSGPAQETYVRGDITATATITVFQSEVTTPARGDRFTFHSENWKLDAEGVIERIEDQFFIIALERID